MLRCQQILWEKKKEKKKHKTRKKMPKQHFKTLEID